MKKLIISGIKMPVIHENEDVFEKAKKLLKRYSIATQNSVIYKKSLDARRKNDIHFEYSVMADVNDKCHIPQNSQFRIVEDLPMSDFHNLKAVNLSEKRILIVGSGPCGLFAAYVLALCGADVTLVERGCDVDRRSVAVDEFWTKGILDQNTNIQFGEGGAGTFSDGKLNTRIGDPLQRFVLETFVKFGAPQEILYQAKPHIGTDYLKICVKNLRSEIETMGGKVLFNSQLTDIIVKDGTVCGAVINEYHIAADRMIAQEKILCYNIKKRRKGQI